jgi:beta-glucanase (GH16 family)
VLSMASTTTGASVHYTIDGSTPTISSAMYLAPLLISSGLTIKAVGTAPGSADSPVASWSLPGSIPSGTLVWSEEFSNGTATEVQPNAKTWGYETGASGWGNSELEDYCGWNSATSPCDPANRNAYVGTDGYLHIVAEQPSPNVFTSARMKSEGLFSILYGRVEARIKLPEGQGFWPAFWMLGNNVATDNWPACGELDIAERVNSATDPDWNAGSIHGAGFTGINLSTKYYFLSGQNAAGWHTYGMIWSPKRIAYYIDDPANVYAEYTPSTLNSLSGAVWPFDSGNGQFFILNLAVGGNWPGNPDKTTLFPAEALVDYVRVYSY